MTVVQAASAPPSPPAEPKVVEVKKDIVEEKKADEKSNAGTPKPEPSTQPGATTDGANDESATDASKPRRATRKSVRISEV